MLERIIFSDRAIISLLAEVEEHIGTETGGVFLGHRCGNVWYVIEAVDPGPNSVFQTAYFEYDDVYLNHLMNKLDRLYLKSLDIIGLWHRHPGSFDSFSGTDDGTNIKYARRHADGAVSALVNIDPSFRLTVYHVTEPLAYRKIKYGVGDKLIPKHYLAYANRNSYLNKINNPSRGLRFGWFKKLVGSKKGTNRSDDNLFTEEYVSRKFTFSNILHEYLSESKTQEQRVVPFINPTRLSDDDLNKLLELIQDDIDYCEDTGISLLLSISETGSLEIKDNSSADSSTPIVVQLFMDDGNAYLDYNKKTYKYTAGMFRDACEFYSVLGDE